jgi:hypothetical protein
MEKIKNILLRIVAVFASNGLAVIGAGAIAGIGVVQAVTVAGITAVAKVIQKLAESFADDGKLTDDEVNAAFAAVDLNSTTVEDVKVEERRAEDKKTK